VGSKVEKEYPKVGIAINLQGANNNYSRNEMNILTK